LKTFQQGTLKDLIEKSLLYLVDGYKDLETILQFSAEVWASGSITKLFLIAQNCLESCSAFDYQNVP